MIASSLKISLAATFLALTTLVAGAGERPRGVIELFTSQGCSSCPPADALIKTYADTHEVIALSYAVDYWDYLGWPDTFAKPEFTERQKAYEARFALREPYTPQVVIDGRAQAGGLQTDKVEKLIDQAAAAPRRPVDIAFIGGRRVDVGSGVAPKGGAEVWLVRYDPREQDVVVKKGDNRGQTVEHINVVREIHKLGLWRGRPAAYRIPAAREDGLAVAILVQGPRGGKVIGVGRMKPAAPRSANP